MKSKRYPTLSTKKEAPAKTRAAKKRAAKKAPAMSDDAAIATREAGGGE
jgi:hypothetical protein